MSEYARQVQLAAKGLRECDNGPMPKSVTTSEAFYEVMAEAALNATELRDLMERVARTEQKQDAMREAYLQGPSASSFQDISWTIGVGYGEVRSHMTVSEKIGGPRERGAENGAEQGSARQTAFDDLAERVSKLESGQRSSTEVLDAAGQLSAMRNVDQLQHIAVKTLEGLTALAALLDDLADRVGKLERAQRSSAEALDTAGELDELRNEIVKLGKTLTKQKTRKGAKKCS